MDSNEIYSLDKIKDLLSTKKEDYTIDYKSELNEEQYQAAMFDNGSALVVAGAGTGKTRVITFRVARLVESGVAPESILLLTFTRKAATEMLHRASNILDSRCSKVAGGTYHSFAVNVLRRYGNAINLKNNFTIADTDDAESIIDIIRTKLKLDEKERRFPKKGTLQTIFSKSVNTCTSVREVVMNDFPQFEDDIEDMVECKKEYEKFKQEQGILDYDDLLLTVLTLLKDKPEIAKRLAKKYQYVIVDEYQDSNKIQSMMLKYLLKDSHNNIMVVGDSCQSIYKFRGGSVENIMEFPNLFKDTTTIKLNKNYRSTQTILDMSNAIMSEAREGYYNPLVSDKKNGDKPLVVSVKDENMQSMFIAQKILEMREEGIPLKEMAVLFRNAHHSIDLQIMLTKLNIPFKLVGGKKLMDSAHIKDLVCLVRILENNTDTISWHRVLRMYKKIGLGPKALQKVVDVLHGDTEYKELLHKDIQSAKYGPTLKKLQEVLSSLIGLPFPEQIEHLVEYYIPIMYEKYDNEKSREEDIKAIKNIAVTYKKADTFLTDIALDPPDITEGEEEENEDEYMTLSTIHSAKGLEWESVFILSAIDGYIPSSRAIGDESEEEEERRLFYVAATRAKSNLFIITPSYLQRYNSYEMPKPSRFLRDNYKLTKAIKRITVR